MTVNEAKAMLLDVLSGLELLSPTESAAALEPGANDIALGGLGIDSMAVVDLCVGVEDRIGRELRVEEIIENPTIDQLAAFLASQVPQPASEVSPVR
jgi:acyl carrier protein